MYIRDFLAIVCTKEGEVVRKGKIKTNETAIGYCCMEELL